MKKENGFTLLETIIAVAMLGLITVVFLVGLATSSKATLIMDELATARNLATSQMESIKSQEYIDHADSGHGAYNVITLPDGYTVEITSVPFDPNTYLPFNKDEEGTFDMDLDIQKITVTVNHYDKVIMALESRKVNR